MKNTLSHILYNYPHRLRKIIILLGIKSLVNEIGGESIFDVLDSFKLKSHDYEMIIDELIQDEAFDKILSVDDSLIIEAIRKEFNDRVEKRTIIKGDDLWKL